MGTTELAAIAIVIVAGLVRGTTGFGGAMLMTPVLSVLYPPVNAVVIALLLETAAALVMFPDAVPKARSRTLLYLTLPAVFTVPLGGYLLLTLDPSVARKVISGVVILFSSMLLFGFRYHGTPDHPFSVEYLAGRQAFWPTERYGRTPACSWSDALCRGGQSFYVTHLLAFENLPIVVVDEFEALRQKSNHRNYGAHESREQGRANDVDK